MARKIVVTSGKGGVGKTTVAAMLAAQLARRGQSVVLCDADFGLNNVDVVCGVENFVTYDVVDVIEGRCRAKQALVRHPDFSNLHIKIDMQSKTPINIVFEKTKEMGDYSFKMNISIGSIDLFKISTSFQKSEIFFSTSKGLPLFKLSNFFISFLL